MRVENILTRPPLVPPLVLPLVPPQDKVAMLPLHSVLDTHVAFLYSQSVNEHAEDKEKEIKGT